MLVVPLPTVRGEQPRSHALSVPDVQAAFRAGLMGRPMREPTAPGLAGAAPSGWAGGPNEGLLTDLTRLPGLTDARAAFAAGRATRRIMQLFDQAGAPGSVGRQFIDNLRGAVATQHMRDRTAVWGGSDTVAMFMEMYTRILGEDGTDYARVESSLLEHALADPNGSRSRTSAFLKALRSSK
jgi:hypothetical protein